MSDTKQIGQFYKPKLETPFNFSLGAGVQSSTMALMAAKGEITPMPDAAIFADTQAEPASVYKWLEWLKVELAPHFPVYTVTKGNLSKAALVVRQSQKNPGASWMKLLIPAYVKNADGTFGLMGRKCTGDYKIDVVHRKIKDLAAVKRSQKEATVTQWIGISSDEKQRMKSPRHAWTQHRWPLIELGMTRKACLDWMDKNGYPVPPRSACVYCPFHSDLEWKRLKEQEPEEFQRAVEFEVKLQEAATRATAIRGVPFLHESLIPLSEMKFLVSSNSEFGFMNDGMANECEGMCGV
jgi:hypothetical protein